MAVTVEAVLVMLQSVWAGGFLAGHYELLEVHRDLGRYTGYVAVAQLAAAILLRWPGRGPVWPASVCVVLLAAVGSQVFLGFSRIMSVHIPLGVAATVATVFLLVWAWRPHHGRRV